MCHQVVLSLKQFIENGTFCTFQSERGHKAKQQVAFQSQASVQPYDPTTYFFHKFGSSFNQLQVFFLHIALLDSVDAFFFQAPLTKTNFKAQDGGVCFKEATIRNIFQMILKFLDKTLLDYLDNLADDIFVSQTIRVFPYKSFSETLSLVLISLLRELLHQQAELAPCFIRDIQDYIKQVFTSGSLELSSRHHDTSEREMSGQR